MIRTVNHKHAPACAQRRTLPPGMLRNAVPDESTSAVPPVVIRSFSPLQETGIQPNSDQVCFSASKLPWKALSRTNGMWTFGMTWNTNCAKTTRATKQPLRVESVRRVRFPRSYLNMCQPKRVASRRLLIPPSRVGCSHSLQLKNRWTPPPPKKQKKISTQIVPLIMEAHTRCECARSSLESWSLQKVSSGRVQTLGNGADVGELLGADQTVADCPLPSLAAALSPSGSVWILTGKTKRSLSPSLSHGRHYFISSIMFVWYSSSALRIAPQALHQWANFSHLCRRRAKVGPTDGSELLDYFVIQIRTFSTSTHKCRNCMLLYERTIPRVTSSLTCQRAFPQLYFYPQSPIQTLWLLSLKEKSKQSIHPSIWVKIFRSQCHLIV